MAQVQKYLTWEQTEYPIQWDNNPYTWDQVFVLIEVADFVAQGGGGYYDAYKHLHPAKKTALIAVIAKVKGVELTESRYKREGVSVIAQDIELAIKQVLNVTVTKIE